MRHNEFTWEIFINMVDNMTYKNTGRPFTKLDKELLKCYWNNLSRLGILKVLNRKRLELNYYYKDNSFFSMGLEPNLMRKLSEFIGEPVNKKNFKEVLKRRWERDNRVDFNQDRSA